MNSYSVGTNQETIDSPLSWMGADAEMVEKVKKYVDSRDKADVGKFKELIAADGDDYKLYFRATCYDAIRASMADNEYAPGEQKAVYDFAAEADIPDEIVARLEEIAFEREKLKNDSDRTYFYQTKEPTSLRQ
eukprot:TRINITY_DN1861_c0_g1_i1.p1 TRINITY_DN1861_c0_g1~~TRINITY_DN1861_c0_g1_i1.p1  ORF type:complete len:133 (-),score=19.46 TRINITY_DN1861_c0_g1_i1:138-536(-)